jgi:hypothetical protein
MAICYPRIALAFCASSLHILHKQAIGKNEWIDVLVLFKKIDVFLKIIWGHFVSILRTSPTTAQPVSFINTDDCRSKEIERIERDDSVAAELWAVRCNRLFGGAPSSRDPTCVSVCQKPSNPAIEGRPTRLDVNLPLVSTGFPSRLLRQFLPEAFEPPATHRHLVRLITARSALAIVAQPEVVVPQSCLIPF